MTTIDPFVTTARTLPVVPRPVPGESFHSWMARISAASRTSLDLILERMGIYEPIRTHAAPYGYGLALDGRSLNRIAAVTGVDRDDIEGLLLAPVYSSLFDSAAVDPLDTNSFRLFGIREWVYLAGSKLCPSCLVDRGGAWRLAWHLPWSFACCEHRVLLLDSCPSCRRMIGRGRRDGRIGPPFLSLVHTPTRCMNIRPWGIRGVPCGQDLTELATVSLDRASVVLEAQRHLNSVLEQTRGPEPWGTDIRSYFGDLRALVAMFLTCADPSLVRRLAGQDLPQACAAALGVQTDRQKETTAERDRVVAAGHSWKRGPRLKTWAKAPVDSALMAAATTAAVNVLARRDLGDVQVIYEMDETLLGPRLLTCHPSPHLVRFTEEFFRRRRFSRSLGTDFERGARTAPTRLQPRHIPQQCWEPVWHAYLEEPCRRAGITERRGRRFASLCLAKRVTGKSWPMAGEVIGIAPTTATTMAHRCVQSLRRANALNEFGDAILALSTYLDADGQVLIDYTSRRARFGDLDTLPADRQLRHIAFRDHAREYSAPAWLWALLTGETAVDAPSIRRCPFKWKGELYRRFRLYDLPVVVGPLTSAARRLCRLAPYEIEAPMLDVAASGSSDINICSSTHGFEPVSPSGSQGRSDQRRSNSAPGTRQRFEDRRIAMRILLEQGMSTSQVGSRFGVTAQRVHQIVGSRAVPTLRERRVLAFNAEHGRRVEHLFYELRDDQAVADRLGLEEKDVRRCVNVLVPDATVLRRFRLTLPDPYSNGEVLRCIAEASDDLGGRLTKLKYNDWALHHELPDGRPVPRHGLAVVRFGGWNQAIARARSTHVHPRAEQFRLAIASVARAWNDLRRPPSGHEYEVWCEGQLEAPSATVVRRAAGGWNELLVASWNSVHGRGPTLQPAKGRTHPRRWA